MPQTVNCRPILACWAALVVACLAGVARAEDEPVGDPYARIAQANRAFAEGRFDHALGGYDEAATALGDSHALDYNRAAAYYRLGDYQKAAELFSRAALSEKTDMTRRSRFGWGNCDYAAALSKLQPADQQADPQSNPQTNTQSDPQTGQPQDLPGAIERLQSAQRHYRNALSAQAGLPEDDPADRASRGNIERAQGLIQAIQELMEQQEQQQQQDGDQDQQQDDQQQENDEDQQQDGEQQDEQQKEQQQSSEQQPDDDQEQQKQGQQDPELDQEEQDQPSSAQQEQDESQQEEAQPPPQSQESPEDGQISEDEIEAILQSVRDKEKQRREEKRRRIRARRPPVAEDW